MKYLKKFEELKTKQFSELDTWSKPTPIKRVRKVKNNVFDLTKSDLKKITDKGWDYDVTTFSRDEYDFFKNEDYYKFFYNYKDLELNIDSKGACEIEFKIDDDDWEVYRIENINNFETQKFLSFLNETIKVVDSYFVEETLIDNNIETNLNFPKDKHGFTEFKDVYELKMYNKQIQKMKEQYDYLFTGKDMGLL